MKQIKNLTPHEIIILNDSNESITIKPEGTIARCNQSNKPIGYIKTDCSIIAISETQFGEVYNLPKPEPDTYYIVSRLVMQACPERTDLLVPNEIIRDDKGNIIGCASLANN